MTTTTRLRARALLLTSVILVGCTAAPPPSPAPVPTEADISTAARWLAVSAERDAAFFQAYELAGERVEAIGAGRAPGTWAVVLDIDDTVLDNVAYQIFLDRAGQEFSLTTWQDWVRREEAPSMPGSVPFIRHVQDLGGVVALVSNRREAMREPTAANLRKHGISWGILLLQTDTGDKAPRFRAIEEGTASAAHPPLEIVLFVGDNILDFPGMSQAAKSEGPEVFAPFGHRYIVVPNPTYGSWQEIPVPD